MDSRLKDVLRRLVEQRDAKLSDDDVAVLEAAVGKPKALDDASPRPLWFFIRERSLRWKQVLELQLDWLMNDLDVILVDAGATTRPTTSAERLNVEITREGLVRAVKKHLENNNNTTTRSYAAMLIGLAKLDELLPIACESISTGREERQSWGQPVIGAYLESLAMAEHPEGAALSARYLIHDDDRIRRAAQVNTLLHASSLSDAELARALEHTVSTWVMLSFPDAILRAAKAGLDLQSKLASLLNSTWRTADFRMIARLALGAHLDDFVQELFENGNSEVKNATVFEASFGVGATWTIDKILKCLEDEGDDFSQACMVAAVAHLDREKKSWVRSRLESDRRGEKIGGAWASVFFPGNDDVLEELAKDSDEDVRRPALAALMMRSPERSPELIELRCREALRHWSTALQELAASVFVAAGEKPECIRDASLLRDEVPPWSSAWLDEAREFYGKAPVRLMVRMTSEASPSDAVRMRAFGLAGLIGGMPLEAAIERRLADCRGFNEALALYLEARCAGGPRTDLGKVAGRLVLGEADHPIDLTEDELFPAVVWAFGGDSQIASRAISNLARFGEKAEPHLLPFLSSTDDSAGKAVSSAVAQLTNPVDPLLADAAALLSGATKRLADLDHVDLLASAGASPVRAKVAEVAGLEQNELAHVKPYLVMLAADQNADVALAALGSLAARAGEQPWVQRLLLDTSRSDNWQTSRQSLDVMARYPAVTYLPRLLDIAGSGTDDSDLLGRAVRAVEAIADRFPERGLVVLDIREARRVNERYGLGEDFDWSADQRTEALRLLMIALDRRKDAAAAEKARGRKLLLCRPDDAPAGGRHLSTSEFETLALFLKVTFTDEDSGSVVAEVGEEASGEVLNALLQTQSVVVSSVFWS